MIWLQAKENGRGQPLPFLENIMKKVNRSTTGTNNLDRRVKKPANRKGNTSEGNIGKGAK